MPRDLRKKCKFHMAKDLHDALKNALVHDPVEWAKQLKLAAAAETPTGGVTGGGRSKTAERAA